MDVHNIQKTGNMHYIYLPTAWCKKFGISNETKVSVLQNLDGSLTVHPQVVIRKKKHLSLFLREHDPAIIHKLIVACYINPASSFVITLDKKLDLAAVLEQKKLISIELVEVSGKTISCTSSILAENPQALLKTMLLKIKNMLFIMQKKEFNAELIQRYEQEIDKARMYIDKAIIHSFTATEQSSLEPIALHYISLISKDLEKIVDHLIVLAVHEKQFFAMLYAVIDHLLEIVENVLGVTYGTAIAFIKRVEALPEIKVKNITDYDKRIIKQYLVNISEVLIDWGITKEVGKKL